MYDFDKLVESFDKAVAADATTDHWALTNAKLDKHLEQSKGEALGGDLTYHYGKNDSLAAASLGAAQDVLDSSSFGVKPPDLRNPPGLSEGIARLSQTMAEKWRDKFQADAQFAGVPIQPNSQQNRFDVAQSIYKAFQATRHE
ncbi:MAG: hypothetical protein M0Q44_09490 [Methylobacter sp.]|jgi:hypothetical protein|nr:hypothetical protein [Methylobacter sp.]